MRSNCESSPRASATIGFSNSFGVLLLGFCQGTKKDRRQPIVVHEKGKNLRPVPTVPRMRPKAGHFGAHLALLVQVTSESEKKKTGLLVFNRDRHGTAVAGGLPLSQYSKPFRRKARSVEHSLGLRSVHRYPEIALAMEPVELARTRLQPPKKIQTIGVPWIFMV